MFRLQWFTNGLSEDIHGYFKSAFGSGLIMVIIKSAFGFWADNYLMSQVAAIKPLLKSRLSKEDLNVKYLEITYTVGR